MKPQHIHQHLVETTIWRGFNAIFLEVDFTSFGHQALLNNVFQSCCRQTMPVRSPAPRRTSRSCSQATSECRLHGANSLCPLRLPARRRAEQHRQSRCGIDVREHLRQRGDRLHIAFAQQVRTSTATSCARSVTSGFGAEALGTFSSNGLKRQLHLAAAVPPPPSGARITASVHRHPERNLRMALLANQLQHRPRADRP